jgi:hypothetical protein
MIPETIQFLLFQAAFALSQVNGQVGAPPAPGGGALDAKGNMSFVAAAPRADFQPYIFWAYSLVCVLLFLFTLWTLVETKKLRGKIEYLRDRFRRAHPGALEDS